MKLILYIMFSDGSLCPPCNPGSLKTAKDEGGVLTISLKIANCSWASDVVNLSLNSVFPWEDPVIVVANIAKL